MKKIILLFMAACFVITGPGLVVQSAPALPGTDAIDAYIENEMRISRIPGLALGIVQNGKIVYLQGYGRANGDRAVTAQTPFIIGSVSKSFTALAAMQLVEEGNLELDAPVRQYLPWFTMAGKYDPGQITVRHLLVQTSGIPHGAGVTTLAASSTATLEEEVRALSEVVLENPPGKAYIYSNANYLILGLIIDTVTEQGYAGHVRSKIFEPLQMNNSFLTQEDGEAAGMASGHVRWFGFPAATTVQYLDNSLAAGFIISSAEDMCRYLLMHLGEGSYNNRQIISRESAAEMRKPGPVKEDQSDYAMGLVVRSENEFTVIQHDGATQGFNSGMAFSPEEQWGVVVLTNTSGQLELPAHPIALGVTEFLRDGEPGEISRFPVVIYIAVLALVLAMLVLAVRSMILLPRRWAVKLKKNRPRGFFSVLGRVVLPIVIELFVPFFIFIYLPTVAGFPLWQLMALFHPDLVYGLLGLAVLMLIKALWRGCLAYKISAVTN